MADQAEVQLRSTSRGALGLCMLLVPLLVAAEADEFYAGLAAYDAGEFTKAFEIWLPLAEAGYPGSQGNLGLLYWRGLGVEADPERAVHWLQTAAEAGNAAAADNLGQVYLDGDGVPQDDEAAAYWIRRAGRMGNATAQSRVGMLHATGRGLEHDPAAAVRWWRRAAEQEHVGAMVRLGRSYALGFGVEKDVEAARAWLRKAAELGSDEAPADLEHLPTAESDAVAVAERVSERNPAPDALGAEPKPRPDANAAANDQSERITSKLILAHDAAGWGTPQPESRVAPEPAGAAAGAAAAVSQNDSRPPRPVPAFESGQEAATRIQLASLRTRERAEVAAGQIESKHGDLLAGLELFIERADLGARGAFHRVRARPLANVATARTLCARLEARDQACIVVVD